MKFQVFRQNITDNMESLLNKFFEFKNEDGTFSIPETKLREIMTEIETSAGTSTSTTEPKKKRTLNPYMKWMKENRESIKAEHFGDYSSIEIWDDNTITKYYKDKELGEPKKMKKPNLTTLVSVKGGQLWKELSDDEKAKYK